MGEERYLSEEVEIMRLKQVVLSLTAEEAQEVLRIDLDGDPADALDFIRSVLAKRVKECLHTH